ncbi:MAG: hypothetical protein KKA05_02820 [Alphaproteobacteria bacterium]|nr:hypothetical protein [Alphaproteobacteria bacterium]MBU0860004.1 hypothetical protein [Alphaproteobacteria bacterium]
MTTPTALQKLTALFQNQADGRGVLYHEIGLCYVAQSNCEITVRTEEPQAMSDYLQMAFSPAASSLFTRFDRPHFAAPVIVTVPGEIYDPRRGIKPCAQLARLRFFDAHRPAELCFEDNNETFEGPTLGTFLLALQKAGDDWGIMDLNPRTMHLKVVPLEHEPKP